MAVPGTVQALIAAFVFGILFNTASTALVLYTKSNGSAIYRDGLRLVLILFFLASSFWALVEFLTTLIEPSAQSTCQVAVVFSSLFDQFGRVFVEQYLAWVVPKGDAKSVFTLIPQILVFGRFFVGIAFTAVTRTQFKPTCVPISSIQAVSITSIALDGVIIGLLSIQAFSSGMPRKEPASHSITLKHKPARLIVVGVALWWGTSVTSFLGLQSIDLFYRTALPGIGLTVLVALVTVLSQIYAVPRELPQRPDSPVLRGARDLSSSGSADYPPSRYEDLKEANTLSISAFATKTGAGRTIRRNDDGTFPTISRPITAGSDKDGNPIQEQLFSAMNPPSLAPVLSAVPPLPENWGIIKNVNGRTKGVSKSRAKAEKLAISNPIFNEDQNMQNSFKKIPTIDLAQAASNDKLRREKYAQRISTLIAQRPAPRPPSPSTSLDMVITEAQMAGELERSQSTKTNMTTSGLSVEGNASSTATQLSPGVEAVRRRSPRQPEPVALTAPFRVIRPGEPIRIPIPRPLQPDQSPPPTKPEPVKTPLQRRPTTGLPSNPRAVTVKSLTKETDNQKTQTVMFVNNIVYSNPDAVGDIIQEATKVPQPPDSADSVLNRPRPIPRKGDKDRQVFPAEISPNHSHRRTKSGGSIVSRKSILQLVPGSPTGLPSLPPIPSVISTTTRTVPNKTKSMTVEEKMNLLYSTQSSALPSTELGIRRRSSLPNLSPAPFASKEEHSADSLSDPESNNGARASRGSKRSTERTSSLLGITVGSQSLSQNNALAASFNNGNSVSELGDSWLPGISVEEPTISEEVKRRSSPVIPIGRQSSISTTRSETRFGDDETITNWGSVYSPVVPVVRQNARSTYIRKGSRNVNSFEEIPIMMVDESLDDLAGNGPTSDPKGNRSPSSNSDVSQGFSGQFHHRPGDDCPTFSARKDKTWPRKMPPPTPLLLTGQLAKREIKIQAAEPSPIESPRAAYEVIQAQLRNFEKSDRESVASSGQRLALLANLEQEMGQLESKWQSTHDHIGRDSMSSIRTVSRPTSIVPTLSRPPSQRSSFANTIAERRASRRARMQRSGSEETANPSSQNLLQSPENSRGPPSQTKVTGADAQYMEQAPETLMKRNGSNVLSISKADIENPSPPETNESDSNGESEESVRTSSLEIRRLTSPIHALWSQSDSVREPVKSWLWEPRTRDSQVLNQPYEIPGVYVRSVTRKHLSPLTIESSRLWQSDSKLTTVKTQQGLWNNQPTSRHLGSVKALTRPATIRPPRKNKRVTLLPDIIENPEPLPNKRGTLGIFQFPWGEKSENATLQYYPSQGFMPMPGTMTARNPVNNAVVDAEIVDLEADEYSSSFFDDYDEGDSFSDFSGGGDDEFDETTLWEIASLLQTDQIPSKNSLLPMPLQSSPSMDASVLADFVTDVPSDDEHGNEIMDEIPSWLKKPVPAQEQKTSDDMVRPFLWTPQHTSQGHVQAFGLPQHESWRPKEYITMPPNRTGTHSRTDDLIPIQSTKLWSPIAKETRSYKESFLWAASTNTRELQETSYSVQPGQTQHQALKLWSELGTLIGTTAQRSHSTLGLQEPDAQVWQQLVSQMSIVKRSKPKPEIALLSINSSALWSHGKTPNSITLWTQPPMSPVLETNTLFRPGASAGSYRTTTNLPAALFLPKRAFRRNEASLEFLTSAALWSLKVSAFIDPSTSGLWKRAVNSPQATKIRPVPAPAAEASGLWRPPVQEWTPAPSALFDPKATRHDFRRTSEPPAAISTTKRPRLVRENALVLSSRNLWARQHVQGTVAKDEKIVFLWQRQLPTNTKTPTLFRVDVERTDYRTTSAEPAALVIVRKPRTFQQPLQAPQSTQLWVNSQGPRSEIDWIAVHTPPSSSPSLSTNLALGDTTTTKASVTTISSKGKGGFFSKWFGKKTDKDSATTIAAEAQLDVTTPNCDHPELPDGIVKDEGSRFVDFDVAIRHPVFFGSLETTAETVHPALTGYPSRTMCSENLHPVTKELSIQHPDMIASTSPDISSLWNKSSESQATLTNGLWIFSNETDLDSTPTSQCVESEILTSHYPMRGNKVSQSSASKMEIDSRKQGLWNRGSGNKDLRHPSSFEKNWLEDSVNKRFTRIELRY
ncbi:hypothetical protein F5Y12DRAFT_337321 [Xylaria sp. FL1777]|nr:hypothetical protein F5Y12DRAFT_337321 [Xylaria sp. FL1777]